MSTLAVRGRRRASTAVAAGTALAGPIRQGLRVVGDVALPLLLALFLAGLVEYSLDPVPRPVRGLGLLAGLAQGLALYWRHSHPRTVTAITVVGALVIQVIVPSALFPYAGLVALWTLASVTPPRTSLPALAALLGVTALSRPGAIPEPFAISVQEPVPTEDTGFALAVVVVIWALAEARRSRRAAIMQASRRAAEHEQARLARELHDVIAHSVSVIVVQAAAGDDVFDHNPQAARQALRSIESAGREALSELRRLLASTDPDPIGARAPQPALNRLEELAEPLRAVGLTVEIHRTGDPDRTVPAGVQLSAYRIVQEALTNTVRHARASRIEVRAKSSDGWLEISITDDGAGPETGGTRPAGRGLAGMRERARLLGGTFDAGPRPEGGFQVRARLPQQPVR